MKRTSVKDHYDRLLLSGDDPVKDGELLRRYMDGWDGRIFLDALNLRSNLNGFEIGVGTGRLALKTAGRLKSLTAIDISKITLDRAEKNLQAHSNVRLVCGDFLKYRASEKYDLVYSSLLSMHIKNKSKLIKKTSEILKNGGKFVISLSKDKNKYLNFNGFRLRVYPDDEVRFVSLLKQYGFARIKVKQTERAYIISAYLMSTTSRH